MSVKRENANISVRKCRVQGLSEILVVVNNSTFLTPNTQEKEQQLMRSKIDDQPVLEVKSKSKRRVQSTRI